MSKEILGIIPARGGSKSIHRKNIKPFAGKPLIAWAIETLIQSGVVGRVIVSTDDEEIAEVAKKYGARVPFIRPAELAGDTTPTLPVLQHALKWLKENDGYWPDYVVLLEPTSPSKRSFHMRAVVKMLVETGADSTISVSEVPGVLNPHWQLKLDEKGRVELFTPTPEVGSKLENVPSFLCRECSEKWKVGRPKVWGFTGGSIKNVIRRRQDLPKTYYRNSSIYAFKPELLFLDDPSFYGEDVRAYVTDSKYAFDIDTPEDWEFAERQFKKILKEENQ